MRSDEQYLTDIVEAADAVARFLADIEREEFLGNELRQSAVMQKMGVIREARVIYDQARPCYCLSPYAGLHQRSPHPPKREIDV